MMYALLLCASYLLAAEAFPPVPIGGGIKPKIAGTVAALDSRLEIRNVAVQVSWGGRSHNDLVYETSTYNHLDFYVITDMEITENVIIEVSAPGFKPSTQYIHNTATSSTRLMETLEFQLELADNRVRLPGQSLIQNFVHTFYDGNVKLTLPAKMSAIKAADGSLPEGTIIASVDIMKKLRPGTQLTGSYEPIALAGAVASEIVIDVTLRDAEDNYLKPVYDGTDKIQLEIMTAVTKASDIQIREAVANENWELKSGVTKSLQAGFIRIDLEPQDVNKWALFSLAKI